MKAVRSLVVSMAFLGVASHSAGQAPAANEGVCDELKWATPGLYGLCVAFCEAQACAPDLSLADPFGNCGPSAPKLLGIYDKKRQPGDPDMPCIQQPSHSAQTAKLGSSHASLAPRSFPRSCPQATVWPRTPLRH